MLAPGALLVGTGLLACLGSPEWLAGLRIALAAATLIWLPGWAIGGLLGLCARIGLLERLAVAFALGCGLLSVEALFAYALRPPLLAVILVHLGITAGLFVASALRARPLDSEAGPAAEATRGRRYLWLLVVGLAVYALAASHWAGLIGPQLTGDTWFHLANISKLLRGGTVSPDCSFYKGVGADPRYPWPVWHLAAAMVARAAGADTMLIWVHLSCALPFLALCSLAFLVRVVLGSERAKWAAMAAAALSFPAFYAGFVYALRFPYPMYFVFLGLAPVYLGLVAAQLQEPRRAGLLGVALVSLAMASSHTMGILVPPLFLLVLGLLAVLYPVGGAARRGYLLAGVATAVGIAPRAAILLAGYGSVMKVADPAVWAAQTADRLVWVSPSLYVVTPHHITLPPVLVATLVSLLLAPFATRRPGVLVLLATPLLVFLVPFNPIGATYLAPVAPVALLFRFYRWPQTWAFGPMLLAAGPVAIAWAWVRWLRLDQAPPGQMRGPVDTRRERKGNRHRRARAASVRRRRVVLAAPLAVLSLALVAVWAELCRRIVTGGTGGLRPSQTTMVVAGAVLLLLLPVGLRLTRFRPQLNWLDAMRPAGALVLVSLAALGAVLATARSGGLEERLTRDSSECHWSRWTSRYQGWQVDPKSLFPTFMKPLAQMPAGSAVVYCPAAFGEAIVPAATGQYVLYGRESSNLRGDLPSRKKAVEILSSLTKPRFPSAKVMETLSRFEVNYVLLPSYPRHFCGALDEYPELFEVVDRTLGSGLYRVRLTPERVAAARRRPDPWRLSGRPPGMEQPLADFGGLALLSAELDRDTYAPGDTGIATFVWECVAPMERDYRIVCHMNADGGPMLNVDHNLLGGAAKTSALRPGEVLREQYSFAVPSAAAGQEYTVFVGLWDRKRDSRPEVRRAVLPVAGGWMVVVGDFQVKP